MEPPICAISDEPFEPGIGGARVRFLTTEAGRAFARRVADDGVTGDAPDEAWISNRHLAEAERLAPTHTLADAVAVLRQTLASAPTADDTARRRWAAMERTRVDHDIGGVPRATVRAEMQRVSDTALTRLGLHTTEPEVERGSSTAPGPEWREPSTTTTVETKRTWTSPEHQVRYIDSDTRWDGWGGLPRHGDLMQGTLSLTIDDTRLYASYGADGTVGTITEYGDRTQGAGDLVDELLAAIRQSG